MSGNREPTLSIAGSEARVRKDLVGCLDGEDASEARVHVREKCHDCSPDQSTVIILRGLYEIIQLCDGVEPYEITNVKLDV